MESSATTETDEDQKEASEAEKKQVKLFLARIKDAIADSEKVRDRIKKNRLYVSGKQHEDESGESLVRANFTYAQIKQDEKRVYARNPEVSITVREQVDFDPVELPLLKKFTRTAEILINQQIADMGMKGVAKKMVRQTKTVFVGWCKVVYQSDLHKDPYIKSRINDAQDNMAEVDALIKDILKDTTSPDDKEVKELELDQQLTSMEAQGEVAIEKGWTVDKVKVEDLLLPFHLISDFDDYVSSPWIAERIRMPKAQAKALFGFVPKVSSMESKETGKTSAETKDERDLLTIFELWNKATQQVYTFAEGGDRYLRQPYHPSVTGKRFYPYFGLSLDPLDDDFWGTCSVELLRELQDEMNETRTKYAELRDKIVPFNLVRKGVFTETEMQRMSNPGVNENVEVAGTPGVPLNVDFAPGPNAVVDPRLNDTSHINQDWERLMQTGDAMAGFVAKAKTATEANQIREGIAERSSGDMDAIEDLIAEIAQYMLEIDLQQMSKEEVVRVCGTTAVWPQMDLESIFNQVNIQIRGGSSGKPNKGAEQENAARFGEQQQKLISKIAELRASGHNDLAEALIKINREILRRFDEKLDPEEFLPLKKKDPQEEQAEMAQKQAEFQKKMEMQQLAIEELKAKIEELNTRAAKNMADANGINADTLTKAFPVVAQPNNQLQGVM